MVGLRHNGSILPRSIAVVGAKGGVGRSTVALNLALQAGATGRTLLLDATEPAGDLATYAGIEPPAPWLELPVASPVQPGLDLAHLSHDPPELAAGSVLEFEHSYETIVVDTGSGIDATMLAIAAAADEVLLLVAPELPAVADGYATLKAIVAQQPAIRARCVVNLADSSDEALDISAGLQDLATTFLGAEIDILSYIPFDRSVRTAARSQTPFVLAYPSSPATAAVTRIVTQLTDNPSSPRAHEGAFLDRILHALMTPSARRRHEPLQEVWATQ